MLEFKTETGSTYHLDLPGKRIRRVERSAESKSGRMGAGDWRSFQHADLPIVGRPVWVTWGSGRDEHSAAADQLGTDGAPDEAVTRTTHTSAVVEVSEVGEA